MIWYVCEDIKRWGNLDGRENLESVSGGCWFWSVLWLMLTFLQSSIFVHFKPFFGNSSKFIKSLTMYKFNRSYNFSKNNILRDLERIYVYYVLACSGIPSCKCINLFNCFLVILSDRSILVSSWQIQVTSKTLCNRYSVLYFYITDGY